jgi:hypothetical protein
MLGVSLLICLIGNKCFESATAVISRNSSFWEDNGPFELAWSFHCSLKTVTGSPRSRIYPFVSNLADPLIGVLLRCLSTCLHFPVLRLSSHRSPLLFGSFTILLVSYLPLDHPAFKWLSSNSPIKAVVDWRNSSYTETFRLMFWLCASRTRTADSNQICFRLSCLERPVRAKVPLASRSHPGSFGYSPNAFKRTASGRGLCKLFSFSETRMLTSSIGPFRRGKLLKSQSSAISGR